MSDKAASAQRKTLKGVRKGRKGIAKETKYKGLLQKPTEGKLSHISSAIMLQQCKLCRSAQ